MFGKFTTVLCFVSKSMVDMLKDKIPTIKYAKSWINSLFVAFYKVFISLIEVKLLKNPNCTSTL